MLKYMQYETACNTAFGVFLATWLVARHIIYVSLCWSIYRDVPEVMPYGCYAGATGKPRNGDEIGVWRYVEPFIDQEGTICLDRTIKWAFLSMLLMLQLLSLIWFVMIVKVAYGMLKHGVADDTRSGDEAEAEEREAVRPVQGKPKAFVAARNRTSGAEAVSSHSGFIQRGGGRLRIPGSRDRKEMIGRVGCNGSL